MKIKYLVVYERGPNNYSAFSPDVPGCFSTGDDWEDMQRMMREAIEFHTECLILDGDPVPQPRHSIIDGIRECIELMDDSDESLAAYRFDSSEYDETEDETTLGFLEVEINTQPSEDDFDSSGDDDSFWEDDDDEINDDDSQRSAEVDPSIRKFAVIFNRAPTSYGAVVPDIPGCVSVSDTWEEAQSDVRAAIIREMERAKEYDDPAHEQRMSLTDAMRYYIELMEDPFLNEGYTPPKYDEQVTFSFVEVEVKPARSAQGLAASTIADD